MSSQRRIPNSKRFILKDGQLSRYAFCCGHVQQYRYYEATLSLYKNYSSYVVRLEEQPETDFYITFESLTEARKKFKELKRKMVS